MLKIFEDIMEIYSRHYRSYGDFSVTSLINPPRNVILTKRYGSIADTDPWYQTGSFIGTAVHEYIEKCLRLMYGNSDEIELERTVAVPFSVGDKVRIVTGKFDILHHRENLVDNKVVNVWARIFDPKWEKYTEQQNFYAYLLHLRGVDLKTINLMVWYKDWIEGNALRDKHYPQRPVEHFELPLWAWEDSAELLRQRLGILMFCDDVSDADLPECTPEERWERFPKGETAQYAIMKNDKAKRATRVFPTMEEAIKHARTVKGVGADSFIEVRHAVRKKCEKYCSVNSFCNHYVEYCKKKKTDSLNEKVMLKEYM
jgi:hypothetical protein